SSSPCTTAATVKAASTAPAATDLPLVVVDSPNNVVPCRAGAKVNYPITSASGTFAIGPAGASNKKIYICSILLWASSAVSISLAEGSSSTCGTSSQLGVIGVATSGTAGNGMAVPANGAFAYGNGGGTVAQTATAANYLCV